MHVLLVAEAIRFAASSIWQRALSWAAAAYPEEHMMTLRPGTLFLLMACNLLPVAAAHAVLPNVANSVSPGFFRLVGGTTSGPDVTDGLFTVIVHDGSGGGGAAIVGSRVTVSFCGAADLRICQDQQNLAYTVNCAAGTVSALTDLQGKVDFTIRGGATGQALGSSLRGSVKIFADDPVSHQDVLLSDPSSASGLVCSAPDEDGMSGLGASDFSLFANDLGSSWQRSDFNGDGVVDATDQGLLTNMFASGRMPLSCPTYCLGCATPTRAATWGSLKLLYR